MKKSVRKPVFTPGYRRHGLPVRVDRVGVSGGGGVGVMGRCNADFRGGADNWMAKIMSTYLCPHHNQRSNFYQIYPGGSIAWPDLTSWPIFVMVDVTKVTFSLSHVTAICSIRTFITRTRIQLSVPLFTILSRFALRQPFLRRKVVEYLKVTE